MRWVKGPIDRFVLEAQQARGLRPSPPADRRTLIRRLSIDLLGLPPSPEQVAAFVADDSDDAYERLVDDLLASPHYGERQARHWLDVVRFGESNGFEHDELRPDAWHYPRVARRRLQPGPAVRRIRGDCRSPATCSSQATAQQTPSRPVSSSPAPTTPSARNNRARR